MSQSRAVKSNDRSMDRRVVFVVDPAGNLLASLGCGERWNGEGICVLSESFSSKQICGMSLWVLAAKLSMMRDECVIPIRKRFSSLL